MKFKGLKEIECDRCGKEGAYETGPDCCQSILCIDCYKQDPCMCLSLVYKGKLTED